MAHLKYLRFAKAVSSPASSTQASSSLDIGEEREQPHEEDTLEDQGHWWEGRRTQESSPFALLVHNAKKAIHENNGLSIGEQKNAIQNLYNPLLTEFLDMLPSAILMWLFPFLPPGPHLASGSSSLVPMVLSSIPLWLSQASHMILSEEDAQEEDVSSSWVSSPILCLWWTVLPHWRRPPCIRKTMLRRNNQPEAENVNQKEEDAQEEDLGKKYVTFDTNSTSEVSKIIRVLWVFNPL